MAEMTNEKVIEILEKEKSHFLSPGGDDQITAYELAINAVEENDKLHKTIELLNQNSEDYFLQCDRLEEKNKELEEELQYFISKPRKPSKRRELLYSIIIGLGTLIICFGIDLLWKVNPMIAKVIIKPVIGFLFGISAGAIYSLRK